MTLAVSQIPADISESLSALQSSTEATDAAFSAHKKLRAYEQALGITPNSSATIEARVGVVIAAAKTLVAQALPAPLLEEQRSSLSVEALRQQTQSLAAALDKIELLQSALSDNYPANYFTVSLSEEEEESFHRTRLHPVPTR